MVIKSKQDGLMVASISGSGGSGHTMNHGHHMSTVNNYKTPIIGSTIKHQGLDPHNHIISGQFVQEMIDQ